MKRKTKLLSILVVWCVIFTMSAMISEVSAGSWYEYEYEAMFSDDYASEPGYPGIPGTLTFWLRTELTIEHRYRVTYHRRFGFIRTLEATTWFKVEHWCRMKTDWDTSKWVTCSTTIHMYIQNVDGHYWKWEANPVGNLWHHVAYPGVSYEDGDFLRDRAFHRMMNIDPGVMENIIRPWL